MVRLHVRPYGSLDDFEAMRRVLVAGRRASPHSGYIHIGDLNWWLFYLLRTYDLSEITFLWEDSSANVVGWSLLTPDLGAFDVFVRPEARDSATVEQILAWTEARLLEQMPNSAQLANMWAFGDDDLWRACLERCGYGRDRATGSLYLRHALDALETPSLPDGFQIAHVTDSLVEARASAHRGAFGSLRMTTESYAQLRQAPDYRPELDVITLAPDGEVASYVMGWYDEENRVAEFEPVGAAPLYQRRGLGHVVMLEALRRVRALGAREAIVYAEIDNPASQALFRSVGFTLLNRIDTYRKQIDDRV